MTNLDYILQNLPHSLFQIWYDGYQTGYADADPISSPDFKPSSRYPSSPTEWSTYLRKENI